jgi:4-amino-4-deoxychorismate lyase
MKYCSINGQQSTCLAITERGLAYGDGLFTTAKIEYGVVVLLDMHIQRLTGGCKLLGLNTPCMQSLMTELTMVAKKFSLAALKVVVTAGSGGKGYSRVGLHTDATNVIIIVSDFPSHYKEIALEGIIVGDSNQQIGISPMLAGIKHLNRLEQVLLRAELDKRNEDDLLVINCQGHVVEATSSNVFYWLEGRLCTPEISVSGVNGIIRQSILATYSEISIRETHLEDLKQVTAMFICNALMGIIPVKSYNNHILSIKGVKQIQHQMKGLI